MQNFSPLASTEGEISSDSVNGWTDPLTQTKMIILTPVAHGQVSHYGNRKFLLKNLDFLIFLPSGQKITLDQVKKYPGQSQVAPLLTAD